MDPDIVPTLPRPPALPRVEAPTPLPRLSDLERLRASDEPGPAWLEAIDQCTAEIARLSARLPELDARTSKADLAQELQLLAHHERIARIEAASQSAASGTLVLIQALTGRLSPRMIAALVLLGTLLQVALQALQAHRQLRGAP